MESSEYQRAPLNLEPWTTLSGKVLTDIIFDRIYEGLQLEDICEFNSVQIVSQSFSSQVKLKVRVAY